MAEGERKFLPPSPFLTMNNIIASVAIVIDPEFKEFVEAKDNEDYAKMTEMLTSLKKKYGKNFKNMLKGICNVPQEVYNGRTKG